ncbi:zinc transporter 7-like isoform X2 [Primulina eburnea]|uniref:zinc transporter 7-like isoform X2 n=1 Tax=Primulina eburnea TaxID=1245227 RepID=UPI003C6BFEC1
MAEIPTKFLLLLFFLFLSLSPHAYAAAASPPECSSGPTGECRDKGKALVLKLVAIAAIFVTSMIGVCLPFLSRKIPALQPDKDLFVLVKAFASGVILATGYMHVMPDSFDCLTSECLPENPWRKFPFTTFVAMLSAILTLMVDSYAMSYYRNHNFSGNGARPVDENNKNVELESQGPGHCHGNDILKVDGDNASQLLRYRVVAQVLELGIVVHSVVIGLSMGASDNPCTIRPLVAALCFHQLFEGGIWVENESNNGGVFLGDNSTRNRHGAGTIECLQRKQPDGSNRGGVAERVFGWIAELHGIGGLVGI